MNKNILSKIVQTATAEMALPLGVLAQTGQTSTLYIRIKDILNGVIVLAFIILTLYFVWGVVQYVRAGGEEKKTEQGKQHMIWGIIGMAVAAGAWGLVRIVMDFLGVGGVNTPQNLIPTF